MEQGAFGNIFGLLRAQSGVDFTHYKQAILRRRIKRRMTFLRLESPEDYEVYLRAHPPEIQSLLNDILVFMAGFFRFPAALKWFKKSHDSETPSNEPDHPGTSDTEIFERKDWESEKRRFRSTDRSRICGSAGAEAESVELKNAEVFPGLYKALVDSSDDAIIMKDLNGIIRTWNKGAERIFGYQPEEIIGKSVTELMPPELRKEEPEILARIRAGERIDHYETVRVCKDGRRVDISLTVSPIIDALGRIVGASKIARDISEKKRWEAEITRAHDEAEQASHAKDEFLATLSHELRTPLNPVLLLASESAGDHDLPPGVRANFDVIRRNVELEARLIDDLLDLTRVRTGKLRIEKNDVHIHGVLAETISIVEKEIKRKHITVEQNLTDAESIVFGDAVRLRQIFWNVLKNAIKFTPRRGTIAVESHAEHGLYIVTISDSGIGMTENELASAFEAFKQGAHSREGRFGGLGLGLAITKRFVELHSGSITASSPGPDRGSTFIIQFPLAGWNRLGSALDLPPLHPHRGENRHSSNSDDGKTHQHAEILLVEDHEPTRHTLAQILERRHYRVVMASSAREAMALAEKRHFDVVISDIGLPDGNGYDLFKKIHDRSPVVKGIALSGYGMENDVARSRNIGFRAHLIKPVKIEALEKALEETLAEAA
ncbi:MAG TPA: PAS domain S-box protein [Verrucomicrobiae bacterium]|nr:PAS domain S-box protein [Verrucomicrobiae bacterium]